MKIIDYLLYFVGVPGLLVAFLAVRIKFRKNPHIHPATYRTSESWTHPPILWAAVDEVVGDPHHRGLEFSVGGGASGKW